MPLIIYGTTANLSVGNMFIGGIFPGQLHRISADGGELRHLPAHAAPEHGRPRPVA
ncbi:MAG: hypothetical protein V8Q84_07000 [Bilophila sp.]